MSTEIKNIRPMTHTINGEIEILIHFPRNTTRTQDIIPMHAEYKKVLAKVPENCNAVAAGKTNNPTTRITPTLSKLKTAWILKSSIRTK